MNSTRDRTLTKLKMGRQSAAAKAIDAFIRELQKSTHGNVHPKGEELPLVTQIQPPATWEARADVQTKTAGDRPSLAWI
ncbi:MAG: hypothetical protein V7K48_21760 [Nostoc sp.]|uniref:hypothetical protein n=1 Tax=Nostoc sp. TaxID=1180 RepID=UPI002FF5194D